MAHTTPPPGHQLRRAVADIIIARVASWPIDLQTRTNAAMSDYVNDNTGEYPDQAYIDGRTVDIAAWVADDITDDAAPYLRTLDYRNWFDKTLPPVVDIVDVARLKGRRP